MITFLKRAAKVPDISTSSYYQSSFLTSSLDFSLSLHFFKSHPLRSMSNSFKKRKFKGGDNCKKVIFLIHNNGVKSRNKL